MIIEETFPLRYYINLGVRAERRAECRAEFARHRLQVERMPGLHRDYVTYARGMGDRSRYGCAFSQRACIRQARLQRAEAVLIFEDDVVLHPDLRQRLSQVELPDDWGLFYLGCLHVAPPVAVAPGLVRITRAYDMHAVAIRKTVYSDALRTMRPGGRRAPPGCVVNSDVALADLQVDVPAYAAWPNLAWQRWSYSNTVGGTMSNYRSETGEQMLYPHAISAVHLQMETLANRAATPAPGPTQ